MPDTDDIFGEPTSTREEILEATFHALCEHGYSNLTLDKIGGEFEKSTSLVYHHYDGKDELLVDLLEYLLQTYEDGIPLSADDPADRIDELIDQIFLMDDTTGGFGQALVELRAQATHDEAYRDHFELTDDLIQDQIAEIVRAGVADGSFEPVDPDQTAAFLHLVFMGVHTAQNTSSTVSMEHARTELERFVDETVKR